MKFYYPSERSNCVKLSLELAIKLIKPIVDLDGLFDRMPDEMRSIGLYDFDRTVN